MHSCELNEQRRSDAKLNSLKSESNTAFDPEEDYTYIDDEATDFRILWEQLMLGQNVLGNGKFGDVTEAVVFKNKKVVKVAVRKWKST